MKKIIIWLVIGLGVVGVGWFLAYRFWPMINPVGVEKKIVNESVDYGKYSFDFLKQNSADLGGTMEIGEGIEEVEIRRKNLGYETDFDTRVFWFESQGKKISGMINYRPWESKKVPVVIMVRGYAEKTGYYPGYGSWRVADELAKAGFVTISIDFLGYGKSDQESVDNLEARFEKVVNVLDLVKTVENLSYVDKNNIFFWAHSNGGQIVLSALEITGKNYPTVLWAPMTNPFPQSVLETIEEDSPVKAEIENFLKHYDAREYAFENYYNWLNAPVLIIQGDSDSWCRVEWQEKVVDVLKNLGKKAELVVLKGADHNMGGGGGERWKEAFEKTMLYYRENN